MNNEEDGRTTCIMLDDRLCRSDGPALRYRAPEGESYKVGICSPSCPRAWQSTGAKKHRRTPPPALSCFLTNSATRNPLFAFHCHIRHPGVAMEPLSPLDFYFAGPEVESPDRYRPGGYHPVHLGDVYHQRYRVIHKLGFGTYSTVWLARDLRSVART